MAKDKKQLESFRQFVNEHPKLVQEVRTDKRSWQQVYEDWRVLGEEDEQWQAYKEENATAEENANNEKKNNQKGNETEGLGQIFSMLKNIDMNAMQGHIANMSGAIGNIQQLLEQFQSTKQPKKPTTPPPQNRSPFFFRQD
ncbi:YlbD family protein [Bacillus tianshenii]|nr:YlbD family protein [Bacillus tianshenii]